MKVKTKGLNRKKISWLLEQDLDIKLEALSHHLEISRMLINDVLEDEVKNYSGVRYSHSKPYNGQYSRWGYNAGSVKIGDRKIKVDIPRIYDKKNSCNRPLNSYEQLKEIEGVDDRVLKAILLGLSTRDYDQVVENLLDSFGISHSSVSKDFIEKSSKRLEEFENRDLSGNDFVSIFIDGKYLAKEQIIIVLGITMQGEKIPIGFIQSATENSQSIKELLNNLVERGLRYEAGLLCIIDGSKGLYKAIKEVFGSYALIQRCQWHKRENVLSYLNKNKQEHYRKLINKAYKTEDYNQARQLLLEIIKDLKSENLSASRSLEEGLEETLTLHRLGLKENFGRSFSTTNCIENLNSQIDKYLRKVKYWKTSTQRYRWVACALLEIEQRMRKVHNYRKLNIMRDKIQQELGIKQIIGKEVA
jgi:transposase-like protein